MDQMTDVEDPWQEDNIISLPNKGQLHYAHAGNPSSPVVVIFFAGYLSVGSATESSIPECLAGTHWIAPTIPGNGLSTGTPNDIPYHVNICQSITVLLEELHPSDNSKCNVIDKLYIAGGSYGSAPCQMLYGAPYSLFPHGRRIAGMLLTAPFSPFKYHTGYARQMTWRDWISVGAPSQWVPFRLVPRLLSTFIAAKCRDLKGARAVMDMALFSKMNATEKERLETFAKEKRGITGEAFKTQMAEGALKCIANWDGFLEGPDVLHSDWGFEPAKLDEEHSKPVLVVLSEADELGDGMGKWLVQNYSNAKLKQIEGGHIAALYHMDDICAELIAGHS